MDKKLETQLIEKYPEILKDMYGDPAKTCMAWGCATGDGWFKLIDGLCAKLDFIRKQSSIIIAATQIKQKFGTLRFYWGIDVAQCPATTEIKHWYGIICDLVSLAEIESGRICERCGSSNEVETKAHGQTHYISSLCPKCAKIK